GDTTGATGFSGSDLLNVDPLLAALADNGGPTLTHAIGSNSPARNAGDNPGAPATDQRGLTRVVGGVIDIGAVEFQGFATVYVDSALGGVEYGTQSSPFNARADALTAVTVGGTVTIAPGATAETLTIDKQVLLQSGGGSVRIGVMGARATRDA